MSNQQADMRQHEHEMREAFEKYMREEHAWTFPDGWEMDMSYRNALTIWQAATLAAEARIRELEADAERYRWLREGCNDKGSAASFLVENYYGMEWDEKIDAALTKHKENQG
jgi:hypothetical protein